MGNQTNSCISVQDRKKIEFLKSLEIGTRTIKMQNGLYIQSPQNENIKYEEENNNEHYHLQIQIWLGIMVFVSLIFLPLPSLKYFNSYMNLSNFLNKDKEDEDDEKTLNQKNIRTNAFRVSHDSLFHKRNNNLDNKIEEDLAYYSNGGSSSSSSNNDVFQNRFRLSLDYQKCENNNYFDNEKSSLRINYSDNKSNYVRKENYDYIKGNYHKISMSQYRDYASLPTCAIEHFNNDEESYRPCKPKNANTILARNNHYKPSSEESLCQANNQKPKCENQELDWNKVNQKRSLPDKQNDENYDRGNDENNNHLYLKNLKVSKEFELKEDKKANDLNEDSVSTMYEGNHQNNIQLFQKYRNFLGYNYTESEDRLNSNNENNALNILDQKFQTNQLEHDKKINILLAKNEIYPQPSFHKDEHIMPILEKDEGFNMDSLSIPNEGDECSIWKQNIANDIQKIYDDNIFLVDKEEKNIKNKSNLPEIANDIDKTNIIHSYSPFILEYSYQNKENNCFTLTGLENGKNLTFPVKTEEQSYCSKKKVSVLNDENLRPNQHNSNQKTMNKNELIYENNQIEEKNHFTPKSRKPLLARTDTTIIAETNLPSLQKDPYGFAQDTTFILDKGKELLDNVIFNRKTTKRTNQDYYFDAFDNNPNNARYELTGKEEESGVLRQKISDDGIYLDKVDESNELHFDSISIIQKSYRQIEPNPKLNDERNFKYRIDICNQIQDTFSIKNEYSKNRPNESCTSYGVYENPCGNKEQENLRLSFTLNMDSIKEKISQELDTLLTYSKGDSHYCSKGYNFPELDSISEYTDSQLTDTISSSKNELNQQPYSNQMHVEYQIEASSIPSEQLSINSEQEKIKNGILIIPSNENNQEINDFKKILAIKGEDCSIITIGNSIENNKIHGKKSSYGNIMLFSLDKSKMPQFTLSRSDISRSTLLYDLNDINFNEDNLDFDQHDNGNHDNNDESRHISKTKHYDIRMVSRSSNDSYLNNQFRFGNKYHHDLYDLNARIQSSQFADD